MSDKDFITMAPRGLTVLGLAAALTLPACGGGGGGGGGPRDTTPPTASLNQTGPVLGKEASVVVTFSEPMNTDSLQLGGALEAAGTPTWSDDATTLTLTPDDGAWPPGSGLDLSIDAQDTAGNALNTVTATWLVKLAFSTFQPAATVIG
ncbi:Ig-like domain-containing protein, partial [Alloalcanivorax xenomutans]